MSQLPVMIYQDEDGMYIAECSLIPGFHTYGENLPALYANIEEVKELYAEEIAQRSQRSQKGFFSISFLPLQSSLHGASSHKLKKVA